MHADEFGMCARTKSNGNHERDVESEMAGGGDDKRSGDGSGQHD